MDVKTMYRCVPGAGELWNKMLNEDRYYDVNSSYTEEYLNFIIEGNIICIPYRFYHKSLPKRSIMQLTEEEKLILNCIYTRSSDGYLREEAISEIMSSNVNDKYVYPYIIYLSSDYVIEVLEKIYENISKLNENFLREIISNNIAIFEKEYTRMVSYWNCYYRRAYPNLKDYVGYKIFCEYKKTILND